MWNKRAESRVWNEMAAILILVHDAEIIIEERARVRSYTTMIHVLVLSIDDSILYYNTHGDRLLYTHCIDYIHYKASRSG